MSELPALHMQYASTSYYEKQQTQDGLATAIRGAHIGLAFLATMYAR